MHLLPKSSAERTGPDLASALTEAPAQQPWPLVLLLVSLMMNSMTSDTWARLASPICRNGENNEDVARIESVRSLTEIPVEWEGAVDAGAPCRVLLFLLVSVCKCESLCLKPRRAAHGEEEEGQAGGHLRPRLQQSQCTGSGRGRTGWDGIGGRGQDGTGWDAQLLAC